MKMMNKNLNPQLISMIETVAFSDVINVIQGIGAVAVAVALYLAFKTYRFGSNKWQYDLAKQIQDDILGLDRELAVVDNEND